MKHVTLLDYGMCNLLNVARAFEHIGAEVSIAEDRQSAMSADRLVVPGVGAFRDSMTEITVRGFDDVIRSFIDSGRPMFGICVGMQIMFESSEEFGCYPGLGILPGQVVQIPSLTLDGTSQRVPHIGWNLLTPGKGAFNWQGSVLECLADRNSAMYFVHSFVAEPSDPAHELASCLYGGHHLCAAVQKDNLVATQFHPERSGEAGLAVLRCFMDQ